MNYQITILIVLAVVIIALELNLIIAVVSGILLAVLVFVLKMSRSVIKRTYFGDQFHSRTFGTIWSVSIWKSLVSVSP